MHQTRKCAATAIVWLNLASCYANFFGVAAGGETTTPATPVAAYAAGISVAVPAHRLNGTEYDATVRDLLPTASTPADTFPVDTASVNGLDNMAADLSLSPALFADYEQAARDLAQEIVDPTDANSTPPQYAPAHHWVSCNPNTSDPNTCAQTIISAFAESAWRRPLSAYDAANLMVLWQAQTFDWNANLKTVLATILMSPRFLFRLESTPVGAVGAVPLDGYQMASRLSYFLWSSMPDQGLLDAAQDGSLLTDEGLLAQTHRMLADPKASALGSNFAAQWLDSRYLAQATPDPNVFPAYNPNITQDMVNETQYFFNSYLSNGEPVQNMFVDDFTFANDELATYYGLTPPGSVTPVKVEAPNRNGILSLGAWLTVTSTTNRTSPTKRGAWVITQLMCETTPQVPAGVNATLPANSDPNQTIRQQLSAHDTDPTCASCHSLMDPTGFGLEHFTGVAQYRDSYPTQPIDASGTLPDGAAFSDSSQLAKLLSQDARFPTCLTAKLFAYATGCLPTAATQPALAQIQRDWEAKSYTLPALIQTIVTSSAFRTRLVTQ